MILRTPLERGGRKPGVSPSFKCLCVLLGCQGTAARSMPVCFIPSRDTTNGDLSTASRLFSGVETGMVCIPQRRSVSHLATIRCTESCKFRDVFPSTDFSAMAKGNSRHALLLQRVLQGRAGNAVLWWFTTWGVIMQLKHQKHKTSCLKKHWKERQMRGILVGSIFPCGSRYFSSCSCQSCSLSQEHAKNFTTTVRQLS